MRNDAFSALHPALCFGFYAGVLLVTMLVMHPVFLAVSLVSAAAYLAVFAGLRVLLQRLCRLLPLAALAALLNPLFSHRGVTVLFLLPGGNAFTWEALCFGLSAGAMLSAAALWFSSLHLVLTSDKLMALFGRRLPAFSLLFSMSLRLVPRLSRELRDTAEARAALGDAPGKRRSGRLRFGADVLSASVTRALEDAVATADSMRCRGYGLPGRTAFTRRGFDGRDRTVLALLLLSLLPALAGLFSGAARTVWFPAVTLPPRTPLLCLSAAAFALFCNLPLLLHGKEALTWRCLRSKI